MSSLRRKTQSVCLLGRDVANAESFRGREGRRLPSGEDLVDSPSTSRQLFGVRLDVEAVSCVELHALAHRIAGTFSNRYGKR